MPRPLTVEQLVEQLSEYPDHHHVVLADGHPVVGLTPRTNQETGPMVVIR